MVPKLGAMVIASFDTEIPVDFIILSDFLPDKDRDLQTWLVNKDVIRSGGEANARALAKRIQIHPGVPDSLKLQLGINAGSGARTNTPPVTPETLVAKPNANGTNALKWQKMGNKQNTSFVVFAKPITSLAGAQTDTDWEMVGTTTKAAFAHKGVTPGESMAYKVLATRAGNSSDPSEPATVYIS
jgi:hypothetical protein